MSVQAITWALDYAAGSVTEKVILLVLANYANEYGVSWPSQKTLAPDGAGRAHGAAGLVGTR